VVVISVGTTTDGTVLDSIGAVTHFGAASDGVVPQDGTDGVVVAVAVTSVGPEAVAQVLVAPEVVVREVVIREAAVRAAVVQEADMVGGTAVDTVGDTVVAIKRC
jgi:hypothetical protein